MLVSGAVNTNVLPSSSGVLAHTMYFQPLAARISMLLLLAVSGACSAKPEAANLETPMQPPPMNTNDWRKLTPEEEAVIVHKATERPGSGHYEKSKEPGTYVCRRCGAALYRAEDKFDAGCGWPSFDTEVPGAVRRQRDADGERAALARRALDGHRSAMREHLPVNSNLRVYLNGSPSAKARCHD